MYSKYFCAPAWSIAHRHGELGQQKLTPGQAPPPGKYDPDYCNVWNRGPSWKIGQKRPDSKENCGTNDLVGPGKYQIRNRPGTAGVKFTSSSRDQKTKESVPGPGQYNPSVPGKKNPGVSISGKEAGAALKSGTPGPQTYDIQPSKGTAVSIGKSQRDNENKLGVFGAGPGAYQIGDKLFEATKITFSKAPRGSITPAGDQCKPGPGQYDYNKAYSSHSKSRSNTFGRPSKQTKMEQRPGPGQYNLAKPSKTNGCSFGKARRQTLDNRNNAPGPGNYNLQEKGRTTGPKISASVRGNSRHQEAPGPGQYQVAGDIKLGPKYSISGQRKQAQTNQFPGPGHYDLHRQQRPTSAKIGTGKRGQFGEGRQVPGPGQYMIKEDLIGPSWGFRKEKKKQPLDWTPGPGHYNIPPLVGEEPKYVYARVEGSRHSVR